jgi:hypothetical protein
VDRRHAGEGRASQFRKALRQPVGILFDLRHPNANYLSTSSTPLIERNPLLFWKSKTIVIAIVVILLLTLQHFGHH